MYYPPILSEMNKVNEYHLKPCMILINTGRLTSGSIVEHLSHLLRISEFLLMESQINKRKVANFTLYPNKKIMDEQMKE